MRYAVQLDNVRVNVEGRDMTTETQDKCPKCGNETLHYGYGLAGGGIGSYEYCSTDGCDHFHKTQDPEIGDHE
jgi:hypothetical protein